MRRVPENSPAAFECFEAQHEQAFGALWLLSAVGVALCCGPAQGDDDYVTPDYYSGGGVMGRFAHIEGQGIPQIQSITPVELFPYYFAEESLFFSDLRFFPDQ